MLQPRGRNYPEEDAMRTSVYSLLIVLIAGGVANAQREYDLQIQLGVSILTPLGGEQPGGVWRSTGPVVVGKPVSSTFSFGDTCEAWAVSSQTSLREDATTAWKIEVTPIRIKGRAVTFRLRWVRVAGLKQQLDQISLDGANTARLPSEDYELTLGPGESWPVDTVRVPPGAKMVDGRPCGPSASIRVSVDSYPGAEEEHHLLVADLWLVERLPDGTEAQRSQPISVRGLPNRPFRFYFDSIVDANATLDIYGMLLAQPGIGTTSLSVETRSRWAPEPRNIRGPQGFFKSNIQVNPTETVEIRLPLLGDDAGPFAKRALSIRIRARQLR
jgi:hypothetical protein